MPISEAYGDDLARPVLAFRGMVGIHTVSLATAFGKSMTGGGSKIFVTGGAGFIGSSIVDRLIDADCSVTAFDNFSTGFYEFLASASKSPRFRLIEGDVL